MLLEKKDIGFLPLCQPKSYQCVIWTQCLYFHEIPISLKLVHGWLPTYLEVLSCRVEYVSFPAITKNLFERLGVRYDFCNIWDCKGKNK